jgi:hypothetical protein
MRALQRGIPLLQNDPPGMREPDFPSRQTKSGTIMPEQNDDIVI